MAGVTFQVDTAQVLQDCGVSKTVLELLQAHAVSLVVTPTALKFANKDNEVVTTVLLEGWDALDTPDWPDSLKSQVVVAAHQAAETLAATVPSSPLHQVVGMTQGPAWIKPGAGSGKSSKPVLMMKPEEGVEMLIPQAISNVLESPAIPLVSAQTLYQPVYGTNKNSRYYVVARYEGMNIAVRYTKPRLSIRVEGEGLTPHRAHLQNIGFEGHEDSGHKHMSMHLEVLDEMTAVKAVGATVHAAALHSSSVEIANHIGLVLGLGHK